MATDMDLTLLEPGKDIPAENLKACKALKEAGVALTLSTGRSSFLTGKYAEDAGVEVPLITGNGGALFDSKTRKHIYSADFPEEKASSVLKHMLEIKADATLYSTEGIYFTPSSGRRFFCENYNEGLPEELKAPLFSIDESDLRNLPPINKFLVINPGETLLEELKADTDLTVVSSGPSFCDVMTKGVSKGNGLMRLADLLGIPRENTFAIGDSENDFSMVEAAHYGLAVGNADDNIKAAASYVAAAFENNGFADAVYSFVLPLVKAKTEE